MASERAVPASMPIRRSTAARLSLHGYRQERQWVVLRLREPVSGAELSEVQFAMHTRLPEYYTMRPLGVPAPVALRAPAYRRPWWRGLVARSWW